MKKIIIAYHAYANNDFIPLLTEQFELLIHSGLYKACDKLYIGVTSSDDKNLNKIKEWLSYFWNSPKKVEIIFNTENNETLNTLRFIKDYSINNPKDYILFFHSKGITHQNNIAVRDWRKYMEYFNIERWKYCVQKLNQGFDCCGVMWNSDTGYGWHPHFSGNFWWATTDYINTLNHEFLNDGRWRYDQEFWIGTNLSAKQYEFHNSHLNDKENFTIRYKNHYSDEYPKYKYKIPMTLTELFNRDGYIKYPTDKETIHSYLPIYDDLFLKYKNEPINILEVGIQFGYSVQLWHEYFINAKNIFGYDISDQIEIFPETRTKVIKDANTITLDEFKDTPLTIAIDDGSHSLHDQLEFIKRIYPQVIEGGMLVVEDIQDIDNQKKEFDKLGFPYTIIDLRNIKKRYDDVLLVFRK